VGHGSGLKAVGDDKKSMGQSVRSTLTPYSLAPSSHLWSLNHLPPTMPAPAKPERRAIRLAYLGLLGFDLLIAAVVVTFFLIGLVDGSVSSFNGLLWLAILAGLALVIGGAIALRRLRQPVPALLLLLLLALPGGLFSAFMLVLLITQPNWN